MPPQVEPAAAPAAPAPAAAPAVEFDGLTVRYGRREILHGLSARFHGRVIGLLGPNGAGKSTLIHALLGFVRPASGCARVLGLDAARQPLEIRRQTGYMPENDALIAPMTAVSFVRLMAELAGLPSEPALERAHEALFYVGLGEARYRKLGGYSLGMRQLAKLAQAIAHGPRLLILDEPTNSLDPPARARMLRLIREIRDTGECQILLCSHLLRDVEETCDEVVILKQGNIVHHADLAEERRSNERWLEVEVVGADVAGFATAAAARGCQLDPHVGGSLRLRLPAQLEVRDLYQLAANRGLQLRRLSFRRDTLEDIFLRAMEEGS
ncbi:MAG TPA: ABC transporter ATP-binding protein [Terriglobales bacterium]|nr:ABC transporter ATP-binding protein [Terriglobales bacterium]